MTAVNRLEVIDHTKGGEGRAFVKWEEDTFEVLLELQDNSSTLKIFIADTQDDTND